MMASKELDCFRHIMCIIRHSPLLVVLTALARDPTPDASGETLVWAASPTKSIAVARFLAVREKLKTRSIERPSVLVLCPGENQSGANWLGEPEWTEAGGSLDVGVVACHFESPVDLLRQEQGYFAAEQGSGQMLLDALEAFGMGGCNLYLYGFSGGAHFAASFAKWCPGRVAAWAAYSAASWSAPTGAMTAPAILGCGQHDGPRYGASVGYFQSGRRLNLPWAWVSVSNGPHERCGQFEEFVREAFAAVLSGERACVFVDRTTERMVNLEGKVQKGSVCVLPSAELVERWRSLHAP